MRTLILGFVAAVAVGGGGVAGALLADHDHDTPGAIVTEVNHSGGLDRCGGHHDRKRGGYHYHQGPYC